MRLRPDWKISYFVVQWFERYCALKTLKYATKKGIPETPEEAERLNAPFSLHELRARVPSKPVWGVS